MSIFIYLIYLPTLRNVETILIASLTHSLYAYCLSSQLKSTLPCFPRGSYLIDGGRSCGGVRLLFIYGDSFLVRGERF